MTRVEKLKKLKQKEKREKRLLIMNLILTFITVASVTFGLIISRENNEIKEKIKNYDSDAKVYYLKQEIERGNY